MKKQKKTRKRARELRRRSWIVFVEEEEEGVATVSQETAAGMS